VLASIGFSTCTAARPQPGPTGTPSRVDRIESIVAQSWPERPLSIAAGSVDGYAGAMTLSQIRPYIPNPLPAPIAQACTLGLMVTVTFVDGRTVNYGPCQRPTSIDRLRLAMMRLRGIPAG
jgi:hypothetical protein